MLVDWVDEQQSDTGHTVSSLAEELDLSHTTNPFALLLSPRLERGLDVFIGLDADVVVFIEIFQLHVDSLLAVFASSSVSKRQIGRSL